ncbi:MAG: 3-methylcrotonyl-CoA carboxylase, partial [Bacteroidetes bacterium]
MNSLLIANRGEIAARIIRTCRDMGIRTVAVYSDADRGAPFVTMADTAVHLGGSDPRDSYLHTEALLAAAARAGAEAVHPGYGFLSEQAAFARACQEAGLIWVGPHPEAIAAMGDKARAKALMAEHGVPVIPGYTGDDQSEAALGRAA